MNDAHALTKLVQHILYFYYLYFEQVLFEQAKLNINLCNNICLFLLIQNSHKQDINKLYSYKSQLIDHSQSISRMLRQQLINLFFFKLYAYLSCMYLSYKSIQ